MCICDICFIFHVLINLIGSVLLQVTRGWLHMVPTTSCNRHTSTAYNVMHSTSAGARLVVSKVSCDRIQYLYLLVEIYFQPIDVLNLFY